MIYGYLPTLDTGELLVHSSIKEMVVGNARLPGRL